MHYMEEYKWLATAVAMISPPRPAKNSPAIAAEFESMINGAPRAARAIRTINQTIPVRTTTPTTTNVTLARALFVCLATAALLAREPIRGPVSAPPPPQTAHYNFTVSARLPPVMAFS